MKAARILAVAVLITVAAGCGSPGAGAPASPLTASTSAGGTLASLSQPLEHIHGAAIDPSSGILYAGTHHGTWSVSPDGTVALAGSADDDFMGFTIASPDRWLASGHPGPGSDAVNPLGLIASTDKGKDWSAVSRSGTSDFHALAAAGERVAGYDGGQTILLSADGGQTWTAGASIQPSSLAYAGPSLFAATGGGLMRSRDGGRTFSAVAGAPAAVLLSASGETAMWCVDSQGVAWSSPDSGATWVRRETVGQVAAIAAISADSAYVLTTERLRKLG